MFQTLSVHNLGDEKFDMDSESNQSNENYNFVGLTDVDELSKPKVVKPNKEVNDKRIGEGAK